VNDTIRDSDTPGVIAPPPLLFALPIALGALLQRLIPIRRPAAELMRVCTDVGIALLVVSLAFGLSANWVFRRAGTSVLPTRPSAALVSRGPFRFTRNPMYLGLTLLDTGVALVAWAPWILILLPGAVLAVRYGVIAREERYLARRFGDAYRDYTARVRRWI
jgi:protein-S-isoprenylcysteine O-methyltransferase Ste14